MRKHLPGRLITASLLLAACTHAAAYEITGKVIKVADGDTITIMETNHNKQKILPTSMHQRKGNLTARKANNIWRHSWPVNKQKPTAAKPTATDGTSAQST